MKHLALILIVCFASPKLFAVESMCVNVLQAAFDSNLVSDDENDWDRLQREATRRQDSTYAWDIWANQIKDSTGSWYRGMFLAPDGKDLKVILTEGLKVKKTHYREIWFSKEPSESIGYMIGTFAEGSGKGLRIRVLLKLRKNAVDNGVSVDDVPAFQILKIYIFDKDGPARFPFRIYKPRELLSLLDSNVNESASKWGSRPFILPAKNAAIF